MKLLFVVMICLVAVNASSLNIEKCLEKNSLTCLQSYAYRQVREISNQDNIPLIFGLELVRDSNRGARSMPDGPVKFLESEEIGDVEKREEVLEDFVITKVSEIVSERSLTWNIPLNGVATTVKSLAENLPKSIAEGRGKKILKSLIPFILGMKLKVVGFLLLSYLAIALIAKQAVVASVIALAISALGWVKHHLYHARNPQYTEHHLGLGGALPSFGQPAGLELGDAYSANLAHGLAYGNYKPFIAARK